MASAFLCCAPASITAHRPVVHLVCVARQVVSLDKWLVHTPPARVTHCETMSFDAAGREIMRSAFFFFNLFASATALPYLPPRASTLPRRGARGAAPDEQRACVFAAGGGGLILPFLYAHGFCVFVERLIVGGGNPSCNSKPEARHHNHDPSINSHAIIPFVVRATRGNSLVGHLKYCTQIEHHGI